MALVGTKSGQLNPPTQRRRSPATDAIRQFRHLHPSNVTLLGRESA
jgi:hypothetical protein